MDLVEKMERFKKRWNITSEDSPEESFAKFKVRVLNIFKGVDGHVSIKSITMFCQFYGIEERWKHSPYGNSSSSSNIFDRLRVEGNEAEFYKLLEVIFSLDIKESIGYDHRVVYGKRMLFEQVVDAIAFSNINLAITATKDEIILYPKGEEFLDREIVNHTLAFLEEQANSHFEQALKFYQEGKSVKSADSLRRSLEEFLRQKLQNKKGLDVNISEFQKKLKDDGRDAQVRKIIAQTMVYLDQYFNENSKHNDGDIDEQENEFLIYQTAVLMRFIERVI